MKRFVAPGAGLRDRRARCVALLRVGLAAALCGIGGARAVGAQSVHDAKTRPAADTTLRSQLQEACAAVWVAWSRNDQVKLRQLTPPGMIVVVAGDFPRQDREQFLASAESFADHHGRVVLLELSETNAQPAGDGAVLYARYAVTYEYDGHRMTNGGRATVAFIRRNGTWQGVEWHLDSGR
jgi:hypothetical protein